MEDRDTPLSSIFNPLSSIFLSFVLFVRFVVKILGLKSITFLNQSISDRSRANVCRPAPATQ